ncbi:Replication factor C subunit 3 [Dictyocoela muelleri]|nr:Replication factor C subunit 3 [Dictyocoela muelleri]
MENIKVLSGLDELIKLSNGDMRAVLNDLEGIHKGFGVITTENVHKFTGIVKIDFNDNLNFKSISQSLDKVQGQIDGISICHELAEKIRKCPSVDKLEKLKQLAEIEYNLSLGCSDELQINGIKGIFKD